MTCSEHLSRECELPRQRVILVVEDDILVRLTAADYLRDAGNTVIEAANAAEALDVFMSGEPVDVVFTDVQMPGRNGRADARALGSRISSGHRSSGYVWSR
jgi:CheY-like chemotaxis protein